MSNDGSLNTPLSSPTATGSLSSVPIFSFYENEHPIKCVDISDDGNFCASGAEDGKVFVWDTRTGLEAMSYQASQTGRFVFVIYEPSVTLMLFYSCQLTVK